MGSRDDYQQCYRFWCEKYGTYPLKELLSKRKQSLVLNVDILSGKDWAPILKCLENNADIKEMTIKSNRLMSYRTAKAQLRKNKILNQQQSFCFHSISDLFSSLFIHLLKNNKLEELKICGIPIPTQAMKCFSEGFTNKSKLKLLSFNGCQLINGIEYLCNGLRRCSSLSWLILSSCSLDASDMAHIASLVRFQSLERHGGVWKDSLRYSVPNLDESKHLHRITLNNNPMIKDHGCFYLINALKEDLWLNAIDLQNTGLTDLGANLWLQLLDINMTLSILDLRNNPLVTDVKLDAVDLKLSSNNLGRPLKFKLLPINNPEQRKKLKVTHRKNIKLNTSQSSAKFCTLNDKGKALVKQVTLQLEQERQAHGRTKQALADAIQENERLARDLSATKESVLDEESLNKIESSLKKFHMFVDMLRATNLSDAVQPMLEQCIKIVENGERNSTTDNSNDLSLNEMTWNKFKELAMN